MKNPSSSKNNSNGKNIDLNDDVFDLNHDGGFDLNVVGTSHDDNSSDNNDIKCVIDLNLEADFDDSKDLSPITESLGQKTENLCQKTKTFGSNNGSLGENMETFGQNSGSLGEKTKNCGPNIGSLGKNMEICGSNSRSLGEKTGTFGENTESLGEKTKTIGPNIASLGEKTETIVSKIEGLGEKTECCFDLNMGFLDEVDNNGNNGEDGCVDDKVVGDCLNENGKENNGVTSGIGSNGNVTVVPEDGSKDNGSSPVCDEIEKTVKTVKRRKRGLDEIGRREGNASGVVLNGEIISEDCSKDCSDIPVCDDFATPRTEKTVKRRKKVADSGNSSVEMTLRRSSRRLAKGGGSSTKIAEYVDNDLENDAMLVSRSTVKRRKRRKKIEVLENGNSEMKTPSRRTSRRLVSSLSVDNGSQSSFEVGVKLEERFTTTGCQQSEECSVLPPKLKLPPSSGNLDLDGVSVLSVFSVYTCLRSFSTLLFLSPFSVEDFTAALKCNIANMLFDSIHVSLLQKLKKHMEFLSDENIPSAANCLRNLNWDLLDSITWPIFMVDYLLIHGSALNDGLDLPKLKLFESEYYKQPAGVKIEILRSLCDDVMEAETIRLELNRRTLATDPNMDIDRNFKSERSKRRKTSIGALGGSCLTEEVANETIDWNSDECFLCKMDGSLICCDGCPAAYHMKCVGVSSDTLPDGDWYCPECSVDKGKPWLKMGKSFRGAEILGVDPHGVVYYLSAGYLLVLDSSDSESSCCYYHGNDLTPIIEALLASGPRYEPIVDAISKHLSIFASHNGSKSKTDSHNVDLCPGKKEQASLPSALQQHVAPLKPCTGDEILDKKYPEENSVAAQHSGSTECDHLAKSTRMEHLLSESVETSQTPGVQKLPVAGSDVLKSSIASSNGSGTLDATLTIRDVSLTSANLGGELEDSIQPSPVTKGKQGEGLQGQPRIRYINCYGFAHTSSMVAEELTRRSVEKITESSSKSAEHMISTQLKAASKSSTKFSWPMFHGADARKDICGWCFACRAAEDNGGSSDCIFKVKVSNLQGFGNELSGLYLRQSLEGHVVDVLGYMLYMEDRLRGLLLGPWVNPHYSETWRQSVVKASNVASLKHFLLMLEANMHRLAIAPDWNRHVDSVTTMGSASHIVTSSSRMSSKHGFGRKRARGLGEEPKPSLNKMSGLGILWWRGGRISRELFSWKVLPHALASKAARQAGCQMVPGLLYPESTDFTKRSRSIVWKAAVELSRSAEQLALQVRELDANIRWDDIENTHLLAKTDQYKKSVRSFKKVIIRKKLTEGAIVKYLLDFGKRRFIPDIVLTHGSMVEETSSERKKYWLEDTHVPLHLLKIFEERRIARKTSKINPVKHHPSDKLTKRTPKIKGLPYLFARAEESKYYQCGQCNKDVLIREAVCCKFCKDFFHKRHVKKSPVATASEITYSCHKCRGGKIAKPVNKKGKKVVSYKSKNSSVGARVLRSNAKKKAGNDTKPAMKHKNKKSNAVVLPLRRSPRKLKVATVQKRKVGRPKKGNGKGKQIKTTKDVQKQPKKSALQKKRTQTGSAYWLNGIRFSRKQHDERVVVFKGKNLIIPSSRPSVSMPSPPKCSLSCEKDFTPSLSYISCEICEDWFHGDAFGLSGEIMDSIIGFRCHKCRDMTSPVCPNLHRKTNDETNSGEVNTCDGDQELKSSLFGDQSNCKDQELGDLASNVENIKLPDNEEERRGAVENSKDVDNISSSIPIPTSCQSKVENIKLPDREEGRTEAVGYCKNVDDSIADNTTVAMDVD